MSTYYPYFGNTLHQAEVIELYETLRDSNLLDANSKIKVDEKLKINRDGKKTWRDMIITGYKDRIVPENTIDDINHMNQLHTAEVTKTNREKTRQVEEWKTIVKSAQIRIDDLAHLSTKDALATAEIKSIMEAKIQVLNGYVAAAQGPEQEKLRKERDLMTCDLRYKIHECTLRNTTYKNQIAQLETRKRSVNEEIDAMEFIASPETINKNLILHSHNMVKGWVPSTQKYTMLKNTKTPPDAEIFKNISFEPETNLTNLPLTISKLISYSEIIGADDKCLLAIILQFMNKYKKDLMNTFEPKKHSLHALIYAIADQCSTAQEKITVLKAMKGFYRREDESYAASLARFDSMYLFYLQLDRPQQPEELKHLSYRIIQSLTQFIISDKCAQVYASWEKIQRQKGHTPTKEEIIAIIGELEDNADLKPKSALRIAPQIIAGLLHLPSEDTQQVTVSVAKTSKSERESRKKTKNEKTIRSNNASPSNQSRSRPDSPFSPSNNDRRPSTRSPSASKQNPPPQRSNPPRQWSNSPGPGSNSRPPRSRSSSQPRGDQYRKQPKESYRENWRREFYQLQFPPNSSDDRETSDWKQLLKNFADDFNTVDYHKNGIPVKNSEKFRDVRIRNKCLRCYGDHRANTCHKFTVRTPTPCQYCRYLYHPSEQCPNYTQKGNTRPPSRSQSPHPKNQ